jgi:cystathionine beta-lyase/cystathionine gamma-synthase
MYEKIFATEYMTLGGILSPFNASMILRGLRTLPIRLKEVAANTLKVVDFLEGRQEVKQIYYPFLPSHPQYALAMRDIKLAGGQFSITLNTDNQAKIEAFCNALKLFLMACSWGGYESLIFPALTLYTSENYKTGDLPPNMIRFYVGLDNPDELIEDLKNGFHAMNEA